MQRLSHHGADVTASDAQGRNAVATAISAGDLTAARECMKLGVPCDLASGCALGETERVKPPSERQAAS